MQIVNLHITNRYTSYSMRIYQKNPSHIHHNCKQNKTVFEKKLLPICICIKIVLSDLYLPGQKKIFMQFILRPKFVNVLEKCLIIYLMIHYY